MVADFNNDDWISTVLTHDKARAALVVRIHAKRHVQVLEFQGFASDIEVFGLSMPEGFRKMQFGEGTNIPDGMKDDIAHMNRLNFRWGCDFELKPGSDLEIRIPAAGVGKDKAVLTIVYRFPRFLGLLKGKQSQYARLSQ